MLVDNGIDVGDCVRIMCPTMNNLGLVVGGDTIYVVVLKGDGEYKYQWEDVELVAKGGQN